MLPSLQKRNRTFKSDMEAARRVQRHLLPPLRQSGCGLKLSHYYHPLDCVGGDFLDTRWRSEGSLVLLVADVSGHGASAALTSAMVKTIFQRAAEHVLNPGEILTAIASELRQTGDAFQFVTAIAAVFGPVAQTVTFGSAGHPPPMLLSEGKASVIPLVVSLPLLVEPGQTYTEYTTMTPHSGDRLIFYTDGVTEAMNAEGKMLGTDGLGSLVEDCRSSPVEALSRALFLETRAYTNGKLRDDVAIACVEWTGPTAGVPGR
jgi:sigma-B regulation protein RsbU (phosphoserine phosphatase)